MRFLMVHESLIQQIRELTSLKSLKPKNNRILSPQPNMCASMRKHNLNCVADYRKYVFCKSCYVCECVCVCVSRRCVFSVCTSATCMQFIFIGFMINWTDRLGALWKWIVSLMRMQPIRYCGMHCICIECKMHHCHHQEAREEQGESMMYGNDEDVTLRWDAWLAWDEKENASSCSVRYILVAIRCLPSTSIHHYDHRHCRC